MPVEVNLIARFQYDPAFTRIIFAVSCIPDFYDIVTIGHCSDLQLMIQELHFIAHCEIYEPFLDLDLSVHGLTIGCCHITADSCELCKIAFCALRHAIPRAQTGLRRYLARWEREERITCMP